MTGSIWAWVRLLGGAAILALVMWRLGTGAFLDGLRVLDTGALAAALGIGAATTVLSAWRWCLVARGLGMRLPLRDAIADYYQALFLNAALPGGVLGDVGRAIRHGRDEGDLGRGVRAVVLERTAGQIVLLILGGLVLFTVPSPVLNLFREHGVMIAVVVLSIATAGGLVVATVRRGRSRAAGAARTGLAEIRSGLLSRQSGPGVLLASVAVLAGHLATFFVAARAAGSIETVATLAPLLLLALFAMALPLNVGGWGPREGVLAWAFGAAGLSAAQGLTIAVAYGILAFVAAAPGAVVVLMRLLARRERTVAVPAGTVPALTASIPAVPALPAPAFTVPAFTVPQLTLPALTVPARVLTVAPVSPAPVMAARPLIVPAPIPVVRRTTRRQPAGVAA